MAFLWVEKQGHPLSLQPQITQATSFIVCLYIWENPIMEINLKSFWLELQSLTRNKKTSHHLLKKFSLNPGSLVSNRLIALKYEFKMLKKKKREDDEENVFKKKKLTYTQKAIRNRDQQTYKNLQKFTSYVQCKIILSI